MTTVVYRGGIVAADRRVTNGGWVMFDTDVKLTHLPDGRILAETGDSCSVGALKAWVAGDRAEKQPDGDCRIIEFSAESIVVFEGCGSYPMNPNGFYAWGSGSVPALGALHAGATAIRAVEIAALVDPCTGGGVDFIAVGSKE